MKPYLLTSEIKRKNIKALDNIFRFRELLLLNMKIEKFYLFGSFLDLKKRKFTEWGDVDIVVISDDFRGKDSDERRKYINSFIFKIGCIPSIPLEDLGNEDLKYYGDPNEDICFDCCCYTSKEFNTEMFPFISKIKNQCMEVDNFLETI